MIFFVLQIICFSGDFMNVYDFDNTIYDGESAVDFFKFCIKRKKSLARLFPLMLIKLVKYKLCLVSGEEIERYIGKYSCELFSAFPDIEKTTEEFWDKNFRKIKHFYLENKRSDDVILSASFGFLLKEPIKRLGIKNVISSEIDLKSGKLVRLCYKEKKVELLKPMLSGEKITFFTDSMNDRAMIDFSDSAFLVKGERLIKLK